MALDATAGLDAPPLEVVGLDDVAALVEPGHLSSLAPPQLVATLVDADADLRIDQLANGVWYGTIDTGDTTLSFNGCFTGCRDNECVAPDNECVIPMFVPEMEEMGMNGN